jgi:homoserine dehydrogenase
LRVGILGYGTVGSGTYRMLQDNREAIERKAGVALEVAKIGIKDPEKTRDLAPDLFTTNLDSIVDDPSIDVVLELIGGVDLAERLVERALNSGKNVVTANKELMAKQGARLLNLARDKGLDLHYEAAVGGGIPLIQPLKHQLAGNDVIQMMGILNGTTNYILTEMDTVGTGFAEVLKDAQAKGYAEADPTNDVDGWDTAYKTAILASIAFGKQFPVEDVYREGIGSITEIDLKYARALGYRVKLLGVVDALPGERVRGRVHPALVPQDHPLASVAGVYNALWVHGDFVGDVMFSGRGAGSDPTASAVVGDLIDVARNFAVGGQGSAIPYGTGMETEPIGTLRSAYYLRMVVLDQPFVLGSIANCFSKHNISLATMEMKVLDEERGEIVFLTHPCLESDFRTALNDLKVQEIIKEIANAIRVV